VRQGAAALGEAGGGVQGYCLPHQVGIEVRGRPRPLVLGRIAANSGQGRYAEAERVMEYFPRTGGPHSET